MVALMLSCNRCEQLMGEIELCWAAVWLCCEHTECEEGMSCIASTSQCSWVCGALE